MNKLFLHVAGSQLYGTDTPKSDRDLKGVYLPPLSDVVLGKAEETLKFDTNKKNTRNTSLDKDEEYKDLRRFLKDCMAGQTYALEMLFVPPRFTVVSSSEWEALLKNKEKLFTKKAVAFVGYARQQAAVYSRKGGRLEELEGVVNLLKEQSPSTKLSVLSVTESENVFWTTKDGGKHLSVLGKLYQSNRKCGDVQKLLEHWVGEYGDRSRASKSGADWKAVSHALRVMYEALDFFREGQMVFPLKQADYVKSVKMGLVSKEEVETKLTELLAEVEAEAEKSTFPADPDTAFWDDFVLSVYGLKKWNLS